MRDPFANYDQWLCEPQEREWEDSDRFETWAEENDYDLMNLQDFKDAEEAYRGYLESEEEDWAFAKYEAYLDRQEMERDEVFDYEY